MPPKTERNPSQAQLLNEQGLTLVEKGDHSAAEKKFREALSQDIWYAPAHNNLGLTLVRSEDFYEAAWEFQYAAKLTPRSPEPRANLGTMYESLGRIEPAISEYEAALEVDPNNIETMQHLARAKVKAGHSGDKLKQLLEKLLLINENQQWDYWIRGQLVRLSQQDSQDEGHLAAPKNSFAE